MIIVKSDVFKKEEEGQSKEVGTNGDGEIVTDAESSKHPKPHDACVVHKDPEEDKNEGPVGFGCFEKQNQTRRRTARGACRR